MFESIIRIENFECLDTMPNLHRPTARDVPLISPAFGLKTAIRLAYIVQEYQSC